MKKWIAALLVFCNLCSFLPAFAETSHLITEAGFYTGLLYYCDAENGTVVLKNIAPMGKWNLENTETADEAEYTEISIAGTAKLPDGNIVPLTDCNLYADSRVRVLMVRTKGNRLTVINLKFL